MFQLHFSLLPLSLLPYQHNNCFKKQLVQCASQGFMLLTWEARGRHTDVNW
jgi:hypothetical protein